MGTVRRVCRNVRRWQNAAMALRWTAAGMFKGGQRIPWIESLHVLKAALAVRQSKYATHPVEDNAAPHSIIHGDACFAYFNKITDPQDRLHRLRQ